MKQQYIHELNQRIFLQNSSDTKINLDFILIFQKQQIAVDFNVPVLQRTLKPNIYSSYMFCKRILA